VVLLARQWQSLAEIFSREQELQELCNLQMMVFPGPPLHLLQILQFTQWHMAMVYLLVLAPLA